MHSVQHAAAQVLDICQVQQDSALALRVDIRGPGSDPRAANVKRSEAVNVPVPWKAIGPIELNVTVPGASGGALVLNAHGAVSDNGTWVLSILPQYVCINRSGLPLSLYEAGSFGKSELLFQDQFEHASFGDEKVRSTTAAALHRCARRRRPRGASGWRDRRWRAGCARSPNQCSCP
jgi:hypothetical protein